MPLLTKATIFRLGSHCFPTIPNIHFTSYLMCLDMWMALFLISVCIWSTFFKEILTKFCFGL